MAYQSRPTARHDLFNALMDRTNLSGFLTVDDIADLDPVIGKDEGRQGEGEFSLRRGVAVFDEERPTREVELDDPEIDPDRFASLEYISAEDPVGLYLKEMARVPLLRVEEELSLAQRIARGRDAQRKLARLKKVTDQNQQPELENLVQDGLLAREHLIKANTRLVVSIAKRYVGRGVPFLDLIQEGNLGLMKAIEKYDYKRGFRFSTYATWWIRQTITRAIADQGRTIRVPVHMIDRIRQMYKAAYALEQELGHPPSTEELSHEMNVELQKMQWMLQVSWIPISLESPVGDDEESELGMFIEDEATPGPNQQVSQKLLKETVDIVLSTLSPREARIIRLRFGLDQDRPYTLEEVGQKFGLTRERVRQIEGRALRRLRHPCRARLLTEYL